MKKSDRVAGLLVAAVLAGACGPEPGETGEDPETGAATEGAPEAPAYQSERRTAEFGEWDADADDALGVEEFRTWLEEQEFFGAGTDEEGGGLSIEESARELHDAWDVDDDGRVVQEEWRRGMDVWFQTQVADAAWSDWDADGDSELDANEVVEGLERSGLYDRVDLDRDAVLDDEELTDWLFDAFDADADGRIDATEWDDARPGPTGG